jgi:hypothetical protein
MKHNSAKYRRRTRNTKRRVSKRHSSISKRRSTKRRISKRRSTRKHRLSGGEKTTAEMPPTQNPTPGVSSQQASKEIIVAGKDQNQQVKLMSGGKRVRGGKRTRGDKRSGSKYKQRGGMNPVVNCLSGCVPDITGYGCMPPVGCMAVPYVTNPDAQTLATISTHIGATAVANAQYDNKV